MLDQILELADSDESYIKSDHALATELSVSRTTIRAAIDVLLEKGIIARVDKGKKIVTKPNQQDYFDIQDTPSTKEQVFKRYFMSLINSGRLAPGSHFSELDLAKQSGCNTVTVREFLIKFSRFGLIEKKPRSRWQMVEFDEQFASELIEFRKVLEMRALVRLLERDKNQAVWTELKALLDEHKAVKADFDNRWQELPDLDVRLHLAIQTGAENRFTNQFFEVVSFVCHYHYQWDKRDEKSRFAVALEEHIDILTAILSEDIANAITTLETHLSTAEKTLMACSKSIKKS